MKNHRISVSNLRKAKIRYYEMGKGCEIPEEEAYVILIKIGDEYRNVARPLEDCNVYDRLPYSNRTQGGEDYGTKLVLACGKEEDGLCYVIEKNLDAFNGKEYVTIQDIDDEIINNLDVFYYDRWDLSYAFGVLTSGKKAREIRKADKKRRQKFYEFLKSKEEQKILEK